jgi:hypothetical protein
LDPVTGHTMRVAADGSYQDASPALLDLLGYSPEEFRALRAGAVTPPRSRGSALATWEGLRAGTDELPLPRSQFLLARNGSLHRVRLVALERGDDGSWTSRFETGPDPLEARSTSLRNALEAWRDAERAASGLAVDDPAREAAIELARGLRERYHAEYARVAVALAEEPRHPDLPGLEKLAVGDAMGGLRSSRLGPRRVPAIPALLIWIPVFLMAAMLVFGILERPDVRFESAGLLGTLNVLFLTITPLSAAAFAIPAYRRTGVGAVLALGGGMVAIGLGGGILPAILLSVVGTNALVTVHNT